MTTPKPKRRWFRFSLRALLVFVVVVSVALGWFGMQIERARRQREIAAPFRELGAHVEFHVPIHTLVFSASAGNIRGIHWYPLHYWSGDITDADLKRLKKELGKHSHLGTLSLDSTKVTDAGLEHLKHLTNLEALHLTNTQVTDAGVEHLTTHANLRRLSLSGTQVTDAGLERVTRLTNLEGLYLEGTQVTDAGLKSLSTLSNLDELSLRNYNGSSVTDSGLEHLKTLTNLEFLDLRGTQVTEEGVRKLQEALPNCDILYVP